MANASLFTLTLTRKDGQFVSMFLDEAVSEDPRFLVAAVGEMKTAVRKMPARKGSLTEVVDTSKHSEDTLAKVHAVLAQTGLSLDRADGVINDLQNIGILFRERI